MRSPLLIGALAIGLSAAACSRHRETHPPVHPAEEAAAEAVPRAQAEGQALDAAEAEPVAAPAPPPEPEPPACEEDPGVFVFTSPAAPRQNRPLRVLAVSEKPLTAELRVGTASAVLASTDTRRGGPPYFWTAEIPAPRAGKLSAKVVQPACEGGGEAASTTIHVGRGKPPALEPPTDGVWPVRRAWTRRLEDVYSAWIEALFDGPEDEALSWPALHVGLRDPKRNLLFDHLGAAEDSGRDAPVVRPDCADLPYFLRAYFAWKLGLPFGLGECNRGGGGAPPSCKNLFTNEDHDERAERRKPDGAVASFGTYLRGTVADKAHSGSLRSPLGDEESDFYPVALSWDTLRPGTIFADPYGHILLVAKRVPQTADSAGVLYAVDGQPDGTIARKRFWRGNFLYSTDPALGGPGFKRFRPLVRREGALVRLDNAGIQRSPAYGDFSLAPKKLDTEGFYDAMDDVLSPRPLDPERAMMTTIEALDEQVQARVRSIENGRNWLASRAEPVEMPEGGRIFETLGPWEDFSTPSRDLRLLIAIDVVRGFPARVARRLERYAVPAGATPKAIEAKLQKVLARELDARSITYTRSDGSPFKLTLAEVLRRSVALEMAYNPNDCVETRWGAPAGSGEAATCSAHAPPEQKERMVEYRPWLRERRRPPR